MTRLSPSRLAVALTVCLAGGGVTTVARGQLGGPAVREPLAYRSSVDVDGDGRPDQVRLERDSTGGRLRVTLAGGRRLEAPTASDAPTLPGLVAAGNVDGRPGAELFVDVEHITTDELIAIYTYAGGALHRAATLPAYGEDYGIRFGISCSARGGRHYVTDHDLWLHGASGWTARDTVYVWRGARLLRLGTGGAVAVAQPLASLIGVHCGRSA